MVRCDDFYRKWQKAGNFCEKHPKTAERIDIFLNEIIVELEAEIAKSEILSGESGPIGPVLTEGASRPLISEHDPNVRHKAYTQIVKSAEENVIDGKRPQVTNKEVAQIVREVRGEEPEPDLIAPKPTLAQEAAFQEWANDLQNKTCVGALPKVVVDLFDLQKVKDVLEMQTCPCCGSQTKATLIWSCCGGTIDDAIAAADGAVDQLIEPMRTIKGEVRT
jgi:hypothetical protein